MGTLANSEDPDKMSHNAAFHHGLHCLLRQNQSLKKEKHSFFEIITCAPQYIQWTILTLSYVVLWKIPFV